MSPYIRWFSELGADDVPMVGGKNASLGEMYREPSAEGVRVRNGFAITAAAYRHALDAADAWPRLREALAGLYPAGVGDLARRAQLAQQIVYSAPLPADLTTEIWQAYAQLQAEYGEGASFTVRSSANAEDLSAANFAGQHETFQNVAGEAKILDTVRRCFASLSKDRAISYRIDTSFDHVKVFLSLGILKLVCSDRAACGVVFALDTESGFRDAVLITGAYALGENVVQGTVDPDEFYIVKPTSRQGHRAGLWRKLGGKELRMVHAQVAGRDTTRDMPTAREDQAAFCIGDVLTLAEVAIPIEDHYSKRAGRTTLGIEWAWDGVDGQLSIVQARAETVVSQRLLGQLDEYTLPGKHPAIVSGRAVGGKIAIGKARVVTEVAQVGEFRAGEVLVADTTMPDWGTVMKTAAAVGTNRDGCTCHAAILARELGILAVVGCDDATTRHEITVTLRRGGREPDLRRGVAVQPDTHRRVGDDGQHCQPRHGVPDRDATDRRGRSCAHGVHRRGAHQGPSMALVHPEKVTDADVRDALASLTKGLRVRPTSSCGSLPPGGTIAPAFYPKPVIVRTSDLKTNEYASLLF